MKTTTTALGNRVKCAASPVRFYCSPLHSFVLFFARHVAVRPTPDGLYFGVNTAEGGAGALFSLTTGTNNTAVTSEALFSLTTGKQNTAVGAQALKNGTADKNTAIGFQALVKNTAGDSNTAGGWRALFKNTTGARNTASGRETLLSNIKPMNQASEAILRLKSVTFEYKRDTSGTPQFGLIAEEVAAVDPDLVVRDQNGEIYTVRYDAVNAMLLNEFLKEHQRVEKLQATLEQLTAHLKEQDSKIEKISNERGTDRLGTEQSRQNGPAPHLVTKR